MHAEFWDVGKTNSDWIPFSPDQISAYVVADWLPSLPPTLSSSVMGWPTVLLEGIGWRPTLSIREVVGRTERQWKGVLSWMLAIASCRHVLTQAGYLWIAPLSAFYREAVRPVGIGAWHPQFPPTVLIADKGETGSRLRPDYIAVRINADGTDDWAIAEAKGTRDSLASLQTCREAWRAQVQNVRLSTVLGTPIPIGRHFVVATRVNPGAVKGVTRRIAIRAWNSMTRATLNQRPFAAAEVVTAQVFAVFVNLGLFAAARALADAASVRRQGTSDAGQQPAKAHIDDALQEMASFASAPDRHAEQRSYLFGITAPGRAIEVELSATFRDLAVSLMLAHEPSDADKAIRESDRTLEGWRKDHLGGTEGRLPFGVIVRTRQGGAR